MSLSGVEASLIIEGAVDALASARLCGTYPGSQSGGWTDRGARQYEFSQRGEGAPTDLGAWLRSHYYQLYRAKSSYVVDYC